MIKNSEAIPCRLDALVMWFLLNSWVKQPFKGGKMLSPIEAVGFQKCVMASFDNKEFVTNWERLRKKELRGKKAMNQFIKDVRNIVWDRLTKDAKKTLCT